MTIKDITILESLSPITILNKPSDKTTEVLAKMVSDQQFIDYVVKTRRIYNQPVGGIDIKPFVGYNFKDLPYVNNEFVLPALQLLTDMMRQEIGLADDFTNQMMLLIFFNACIDVEYFDGFVSHPIQFLLNRSVISAELYKYNHEVGAIIIPFNVSKNSLMKWINNNWPNIEKQMDNNLTTNPYLLRSHKNTELALEILDLKDKQHKTFSKIATILTDNHPEDKRVCSEEWVKKIYYDYKQIWNSQLKTL
jgi:hypothetical protein